MKKTLTTYHFKNSMAMANDGRRGTVGSIICLSVRMRKALLLLTFVTVALWSPGGLTQAQQCRPAVVSYIVRDESGKELAEPALTAISEKLPQKIDDAQKFVGEVYFTKDGGTYYSPYSSERKKGRLVRSLAFANAATCILHLKEVTLTYHNKQMRLVFNIDLERQEVVVESLPFQEGTFKLDVSGWSMDQEMAIPASRWKKVTAKP